MFKPACIALVPILLCSLVVPNFSSAMARRHGVEARGSDQGWVNAQALSSPVDPLALEAAVHRQVNLVREAHGVVSLDWQEGLHPIALGHSTTMQRLDTFDHVVRGKGPQERYDDAGYECRRETGNGRLLSSGENLFLTHLFEGWRSDAESGTREPYGIRDESGIAERVVQGWLDSPPHRVNLLHPAWRTEAIGVFIAGDGRVWITQNFC